MVLLLFFATQLMTAVLWLSECCHEQMHPHFTRWEPQCPFHFLIRSMLPGAILCKMSRWSCISWLTCNVAQHATSRPRKSLLLFSKVCGRADKIIVIIKKAKIMNASYHIPKLESHVEGPLWGRHEEAKSIRPTLGNHKCHSLLHDLVSASALN